MGKRRGAPVDAMGEDDAAPTLEAVPTLPPSFDEDAGVHAGDEMQEIDFDVDIMQDTDLDAAFHLMQRYCPVGWGYHVDEVINPLCHSPITSIVKVPDEANTAEEGAMLNDNGEQIYGIVGILNLEIMRRTPGNRPLFEALNAPATTEEDTLPDISTILSEDSLRDRPVALIVNERMTNLPVELGAQLHANLFEELSGKQGPGAMEECPQEAHPEYEYYVILTKVRMNADKALAEHEAEQRALLAAAQGKRVRARADDETSQRVREASSLAINEDTSLFLRAEELVYFRHRDPSIAVKRYILDDDISRDVVIAPVVIHKRSIPALVCGLLE